ncbi:hypothetical protein BGX24_005114 [Mortierella sp. AD032]|nr:hypothetical protein BGX24_005114 [Mortierella sp. AD032]
MNTSTTARQEREGESFLNENDVITNSTDSNARLATCGLGGAFLQASSAVTECRKNGGSSSGDEEETRDSGIVLEPWDQSLLQHEQQHDTLPSEIIITVKPEMTTTAAREQQQQKQQILPFPSFDQLFRPNLDLTDPQILKRGSSGQRSHQRRQRCQSMYCPPTPRETELDDQGSRSNDDIADSNTNLIKPESTAKGDKENNNNRAQSGPASKSAEQKTRRSKRVASMSIGSDHPQHPFLGAHGLPPLPPLATSTSGTFNNISSSKPQRSSFFCSPALHDSASDTSTRGSDSNSSGNLSSRDSTARRASQPPSNDSTSSFSSTTTIPLSRTSSPPEHHEYQYQQSLVGSFAHGMPFSNMLDLATAKAENITGLYFAKQMMSGAGGGGGGEEEEDGQCGKRRTRAVTSTGSPISDSTSALIDSTGKSCASLSQMLVLDDVRIIGSSHSTTALSSSVTTANAQAAPTTAGATATPSTSTPTTSMRHGLHRRSHSASHFFHLSSLKHHSPAQFNLALCYEHGQGGVEQDLSKALYFYQQAADQGHTKASYNLGCICYNQGEISKAMAWFESAGKCSVKGLTTPDAREGGSSRSAAATKAGREGAKFSNASVVECPLPKATILPHELEDMLMMGELPSGPDGGASGTGAGGGGPFVAYLPAILCLALLCRQGVQTREGEVILGRDPDQAIALLQRLLDRAPRRLLNKLEKEQLRLEKDNLHHIHRLQQQQQASIGSRTSASASARKRDPRKRASLQASFQAVPTPQQGMTTPASIFSTSCPQLPLGLSSSVLSSSASAPSCSASTTTGVRAKRRSTVEDAANDDDDDDDDGRSFCSVGSRNRNNSTVGHRQASGTRQGSFLDSEEEKQDEVDLLHGSDVHEAWSVTLAQQLLKAWQQPPPFHQSRTTPTSTTTSATSSPSLEDARIQQRIVRHHLLYITNPTLGKNFYNLGVLYDLYLGHPQIAQRCYRSAYQNCRLVLLPSATPVSVLDTFSAQQQQLAGLVTRINSAWNLGVLYAKHQEWARAKGWFLKAQEDVLAHERVAAASAASAASASASASALLEAVEAAKTRGEHRGRRASQGRAGGDEGDVVSDLAAFTCATATATEAEQRRSVSKKNVREEEEDESKIRRRSLVNVLPSPGVLLGQQQSNVSAHGRGRRRERSGGRDGSKGRGAAGGRVDPVLTSKDSPGSRHAREHGLMMHLTAPSSSKTKGSVECNKKSASSISSHGGSESVSRSEGIRTDASKVAWVLRWVESNMESSSMPTSSPFSL